MTSDIDRTNLAQPDNSALIPSSATLGLQLTIEHLRGVAERTCSGSVARRCLRLAQLVDEVLIPAVVALEQPTTPPKHLLAQTGNPSHSGHRLLDEQCQLAIQFDDYLDERRAGGTR